MVAVLHAAPGTSGPQAIAAWLAGLRGAYPDEDLGAFEAAAAYARERCADRHGRDGEPLIERAVGTATILAGLKLDATTVRAALLIGLPAANAFDADDVGTRFGADAGTLVAGVARMDEIRMLPDAGNPDERAAQSERLRKMLVAMVDDVRVALIKLAERTCAIRAVKTADDEKRNRVPVKSSTSTRRWPPARYRSHQVGTGGLVLPLPGARPVQADRQVAPRAALDRERFIERRA